jgi:hypothetical protein
MQPEDKESPVQVTVLTREGDDERAVGSGILVAPKVVLADQTLSHELYGRPDLFPAAQDDLTVLSAGPGPATDPDAAVDPGTPTAGGDPAAPVFLVELVDGDRTQRIEVSELYRSLGTPLPWVGFGLAEPTDMPLSEVPAEAKEGLFDPLERNRWVCLLMPKACR